MVAVCGSYLFACGKTSNMQLSQNNLSLQAIWLELNWSMTDPIYSVSCWLIFFCCCIWHTCNCFCFFVEQNVCIYVTFRIYHELFYGKKCRMTQHNKQARQTFHCLFWTVILFNCLNVNLFFLFVCLSDCKYLLFRCVSDTLSRDLFPNSWSIEGKSSYATHSKIFVEKNRNYFSRTLPTAKIKIREN